jgi:septal ring factor EnvC (AmiA/AmiB activator)
MTAEPDDLVLLRRMDAKLDRMSADIADLKPRLTAVERQLGELQVTIAGQAARIDCVESRLDRIERRLDIVSA